VLEQVNQTHMQKAQLRVIKAIGDLLAIARDEGNGGATVKQLNGRFGLFRGNGNVSCKPHDQGFGHREISQLLRAARMRESNETLTCRIDFTCFATRLVLQSSWH